MTTYGGITPLREQVRLAIVKAFERTWQEHTMTYDPDTCGEAADEVIAVLLSNLTGDTYEAQFHPRLIGPADIRRVES